MMWKKAGWSRLCCMLAVFFCFLAPVPAPVSASAADPSPSALAVSLPATVKGYAFCTVTIQSPAAGEAELRLYDSLENPWLVRRETLSAGENQLSWDGLGANRERLMSGPYRMEVVLRTADGSEYAASASFTVQGFAPALALALPSSGTLYLDHGENWFVECWVPSKCIVALEVRNAGGETVYAKDTVLQDRDRDVLRWDGAGKDRKPVEPGDYTVRLYAKNNPDFDAVYPLSVKQEAPKALLPAVTGPVVPERDMTDGEIWEIMMKPSVVINAKGSSLRFRLRESPDAKSAVTGLVCCATQGLEILSFDGAWAQVRAGSYSDGQFVTGWYPVSELVTVVPSPHYGVLVDKRAQTLTVYQDGKPVGTVPVSTGLATEKHPERETPPGAFLTDVHFSPDFAQEGARYDYPLRYQGGNIIHSTGYVRIPHAAYSVKDYSSNLPLLGQKASHGCVRVSPFAEEDGAINSYWLWTHLPYHTRVIILDD